MLKTKNILGCLLVFMMIVTPITSVGAAAPAQTNTIDGTVESCVTDNSMGEIIVVCEINLTGGGTQTIRLSVADAVTKELASVGEDGTVTIIATNGQEVSIEEAMLLEDPCAIPEDASQPISKILAGYFCGDLGTSYDDVQALHEAGFGFGEIAQACFMALKLGGTGDLCAEILSAKQNNDYSKLSLPLPEDVSVTNWGQLKKFVFSLEPLDTKNSNNLGSIVSGKGNAKNNKDKEKTNGQSAEEHGKVNK